MGSGLDTPFVIKITLELDGVAPEVIEQQAILTRDELMRLDIEAVRRPSAAAPPGTRGAELAVIGTLLVEVIPVLPNLLTVVDLLRRWAKRTRGKVTMTVGDESIVVDNASDAQADRLINLFAERHSRLGP
jgi:hypothetical protein